MKRKFDLICFGLLMATGACEQTSQEFPQVAQSQLAGTASVVDGDTIEIHSERIRLDGFDTPERGSMCGAVNAYQKAALALDEFIAEKTVVCDISGKDRYGRSIGDCSADEKSLAEYIFSEGWGRDWPQFSHGAYADEERFARNAKRDLWGLQCPDDLWGDRTYN